MPAASAVPLTDPLRCNRLGFFPTARFTIRIAQTTVSLIRLLVAAPSESPEDE